MAEKNLLTEWAGLFARSVADAGVTDVVLSPGARSLPWMVAMVREHRFTCHDIIDERAAAFFALGQARITRRPTMLLCTSGSAPAHYFPAVVEAEHALLPLLVVTADRPFELQACGAPQTIDQLDLYGKHVRRFFEVGTPSPSPVSLRALRRTAHQAVFAAQHPLAGPVHVNVRASKPLEPYEPETPADEELARTVRRIEREPSVMARPPRAQVDAAVVEACVRACAEEERGVIVVGPMPPDGAARGIIYDIAEHLSYPLLCEATSQLRFAPPPPAARNLLLIDRFEVLLRSKAFREQWGPHLAIEIGVTPTSTGWELYVAQNPGCVRAVAAPHGWNDPHGTAQILMHGDLLGTLGALRDALRASVPARPRSAWASHYEKSQRAVAEVVAEEMVAGDVPMGEGQAVHAVVSSLPEGSLLVVGNSLPLREIDVFCPAHSSRVDVISQRGTNGIDGLLAGAAGAAIAAKRPLTLLLGDVSFLHDLTSLSLCRRATTPLVICVIQNHGGRIFEALPMGKVVDEATMNHVIMPQEADISAVAGLYGIAFERVTEPEGAALAVQRAHQRPGCTVVELMVPEHDAVHAQARIVTRTEALLGPTAGATNT